MGVFSASDALLFSSGLMSDLEAETITFTPSGGAAVTFSGYVSPTHERMAADGEDGEIQEYRIEVTASASAVLSAVGRAAAPNDSIAYGGRSYLVDRVVDQGGDAVLIDARGTSDVDVLASGEDRRKR